MRQKRDKKHSKHINRIGVSLKTKTWTSQMHHFLQFYENGNMSSLNSLNGLL